jgi:hypothetical protein
MYPPELAHQRGRERFDPVESGARHGLSRETSLALWERVYGDATHGSDRADIEQAQRRFDMLAARLAARGGRLRRDVGRVTRVEVELEGSPSEPSTI